MKTSETSYNPSYQGLPLLPGYSYNEAHLQRTHAVIQRALLNVNRVFAARIILRFPKRYWSPEGQVFGNGYIRLFFELLEQRLERNRLLTAANPYRRAHPAFLNFVWSREYDQDECRPQFQVFLFLNCAAYDFLGWLPQARSNLMTCVADCWAKANGLSLRATPELIQIPQNAAYTVERKTRQGLPELFATAALLCKAVRRHPDGYQGFGDSLLSTYPRLL